MIARAVVRAAVGGLVKQLVSSLSDDQRALITQGIGRIALLKGSSKAELVPIADEILGDPAQAADLVVDLLVEQHLFGAQRVIEQQLESSDDASI